LGGGELMQRKKACGYEPYSGLFNSWGKRVRKRNSDSKKGSWLAPIFGTSMSPEKGKARGSRIRRHMGILEVSSPLLYHCNGK